MIRGHLKIIVLKGLSEKPMTGYSLMKYVNEKIGIKPSPGSMYPLLKNFEKRGMIKSKESNGKKTFSLTKQGLKKIKELQKHKEEMHEKAVKSFKIMEAITGEKTAESKLINLLEKLKDGDPFEELNPELEKLSILMLDLLEKEQIEKNKKKIKKIFKDAYSELKKISKEK
ncbi:hypothetical protein DRJ25_02145 [Candidatus Woesearchaeota archaeon]|nr:MAG: hypothetical protein DRJ25_02145 [Candidatus Woesearchaeota archaeon]